jgi:hypothetical protein
VVKDRLDSEYFIVDRVRMLRALSRGSSTLERSIRTERLGHPVSNGLGREAYWGGSLYRRNHPPPGQEQEASQPQKSHCENCDRNASNHCIPSSLHKCRGTRLGHRLILLSGSTAGADGPNYLPASLERNSTGENHDAACIRDVYSEELTSGLGVCR